jgi:glycerol-3-phosphate cytidylyltransferase-like family protein
MNIFAAIGHFFASVFKGIFSSAEAKTFENNVIEFVKTDIGALAVDAVEYVRVALPNGGSVEKRDAAVAKLKADAIAAGKDITGVAESALNTFIELALQFVLAKIAVPLP